MKKIRELFTKWYIKRGYTFGYDYTGVPIHSDELVKIPGGIPTAVWGCPRWVRPLLIFFSPSVYYNHIAMRYAKAISDGILDGLLLGEGEKGE